MTRKQLTLVVVRHGQATHNLEDFQEKDLVMTEDQDTPFMNSPLTEKGSHQATLLAHRLKATIFHFGFASDLTRAWDTAQSVLSLNPSLDGVELSRMLRERNGGAFEINREAMIAQNVVEAAVADRELLTWRIPRGESVVQLRNRVRHFLELAYAKAFELEVDCPVFLVATHYVWMNELYMIFAEQVRDLTGVVREKKPRTPNTGVDQYTVTFRRNEDGLPVVEDISFDIISCGQHLQTVNGC